MHHHHPYHHGPHLPGPPDHPGIAGVFGGVVNLAASALYGGASVIRNVVEGTMWYDCHSHHFDPGRHCGCDPCHAHDCCSCYCAPSFHHCCVQHVPPLYTGCC